MSGTPAGVRRTTSAIALILCLWAQGTVAQTVADNPDGRVRVAGNELLVESKTEDPSAVRVGAPSAQTSVGKFSFDVLIGPSRDEIVMFQGKQTEYGSRPGGLWWGGVKIPGFGVGDDRAMFNWVEVSYRDGIRFHLPVYAPQFIGPLGVGLAGQGDHLSSDRWRLYVQGDGNLVLYELIGDTLCARWAITWIAFNGTGYIDRAVLSPVCR